jgi:hypothetical protein
VDPVPDPPLFRKSGSAGNRARTSGSVASQWLKHLTAFLTIKLLRLTKLNAHSWLVFLRIAGSWNKNKNSE